MLGRFFEPPAGEARQRVPGTRDPRHYDAENVRRNARAAGVATDSGHRSGIPILGRGLGHSSSPNLLHGQTLIRSRRGVVSTLANWLDPVWLRAAWTSSCSPRCPGA
jgi:hypothetical protein